MQRSHLRAVPHRGDPVRVLVVDDHPRFAEALMLTLAVDERLEIVGHAADGVEAVSLATGLRPDVILMDVHMPRMDGLEATRRVQHLSPSSRVVIISAAGSRGLAGKALAAGASRYVTKDTPARTLIETIVEVSSAPAAELALASSE